MYWPWRPGTCPWLCTGCSTAFCVYGNSICSFVTAVYQTDGGILSACRCGSTCCGNVVYQDCLRSDRIFISDIDTDRNLYRTGRFKDPVSGQSCGPGYEHDLGSCSDSWSWSFSKAWCCWRSDCNSDSTGDCYEHYDIRDYGAEERKCTKRNKIICKTSTGICGWNLQDRNSHSNPGYGILCDFHGVDSYGFRIWCRSYCNTASRRTD